MQNCKKNKKSFFPFGHFLGKLWSQQVADLIDQDIFNFLILLSHSIVYICLIWNNFIRVSDWGFCCFDLACYHQSFIHFPHLLLNCTTFPVFILVVNINQFHYYILLICLYVRLVTCSDFFLIHYSYLIYQTAHWFIFCILLLQSFYQFSNQIIFLLHKSTFVFSQNFNYFRNRNSISHSFIFLNFPERNLHVMNIVFVSILSWCIWFFYPWQRREYLSFFSWFTYLLL